MEIPDVAYTTLSHNLIGFPTLSQERVLQADWLLLEYNKKATLAINMPYSN